ncbi:ribosomal protein L7/L12 [Sorangium sp. So ce131]|uniref:ribosomal protein L7/L12 n=1 Tax=Sorangium sp. So ce131 TaxID=3133282 RepID=UPI003F5EBB57
MPVTYRCTNCRFEADLGWFHHHRFDDGYFATKLLVCTRCGTSHQVRIALRASIGDLARTGPRCDVSLVNVGQHRARVLAAIRETTGGGLHDAMLRAAQVPTSLVEDVDLTEANEIRARFESAGGQVDVRMRPPEPAPPPIPKQRDELGVWVSPEGGGEPAWQVCPIEGERRGEFGEFDLEAQSCYRCAARGTLVSEIPSEVSCCPRCGEDALRAQGGWIT